MSSFRIHISDLIQQDKQKPAAEATLSYDAHPILRSFMRPIHLSVTFNLVTPGWGLRYHQWATLGLETDEAFRRLYCTSVERRLLQLAFVTRVLCVLF